MIDQSTNYSKGLYTPALEYPFYYIKTDKIIDIIKVGNRRFYSKLKRVDKSPTLEEIYRFRDDIYLPVYTTNSADRIILLHSKNNYEIFISTVKYLLSYLKLDYKIYLSKDDIQVHIYTKNQSIDSLYKFALEISNMLESRLQKSWQIFPNLDIPFEKNIYPLPTDEYIS